MRKPTSLAAGQQQRSCQQHLCKLASERLGSAFLPPVKSWLNTHPALRAPPPLPAAGEGTLSRCPLAGSPAFSASYSTSHLLSSCVSWPCFVVLVAVAASRHRRCLFACSVLVFVCICCARRLCLCRLSLSLRCSLLACARARPLLIRSLRRQLLWSLGACSGVIRSRYPGVALTGDCARKHAPISTTSLRAGRYHGSHNADERKRGVSTPVGIGPLKAARSQL